MATPQSRLKVLRAVLALERFTAGQVGAFTGLGPSQVDPQIARLRQEGLVEYDQPSAEPAVPRAAHRPIRHYQLTSDLSKRARIHEIVRAARVAAGEDGASAHRLGVIEGQIGTLRSLLTSFSERRLAVSLADRREYEQQLKKIEHALNEAVLEFADDDEGVVRRLHVLRDQFADADRALTALRIGSHAEADEGERTGVLEWLYEFVAARDHSAAQLSPSPEPPPVLAAALDEIRQMESVVAITDPSYTAHARLDYAVCRTAARIAPEGPVLLIVTEHLEKKAPAEHRLIYRRNRADLLAWMGKEEAAYKTWESCMIEGSHVPGVLRTSFACLVDPMRIEPSTWNELELRARRSRRLISVALKDSIIISGLPEYRPLPALADPFNKTMEIAIQANAGSYAIYGAALLDLYRTETGLSYPRLASTLYGIGFTLPRAWYASRQVEAGKALVVVGEAAGYPSEGRFDDVRGLLQTELEAQMVEIR
jgi:hypothetical protein